MWNIKTMNRLRNVNVIVLFIQTNPPPAYAPPLLFTVLVCLFTCQT